MKKRLGVKKMDLDSYNEKLSNYLMSMDVVKTMLNKGIFNISEYKKIEKEIARKYSIKSNSIYRKINLN